MKHTDKTILFIVILFGGCNSPATKSEQPASIQSYYVSDAWVADNGDGTYTNPILHADYSDPDLIRVGDDFYMTASSFNSSPGLPILHSKDLVNWQIVNNALSVLPEQVYDSPQYSKGVWAPCIRFHNGLFYIFWGDPDFGIFRITTTDPFGEWTKPVLVAAGKGMIDPSPLWDDDGNAYLVTAWAGSRAGGKQYFDALADVA